MVRTIEFYKDGDLIMVEYNSRKFGLPEFLNSEDSKYVVTKIFNKIKKEYSHLILKEVKDMNNKGEVVGVFIKKYFLQKKDPYDVVIMGDGSLVKFDLESEPVNLSNEED